MKKTNEATIHCPECHGTNLVKQGVIWSGRTEVQQYRCKDCGRNTVKPVEAIKSA